MTGDEWQRIRSLVQQDMMRPKSALFYIDDMSSLMDEFIQKLDGKLDQQNKVDDITTLCYEFALDAIGVMFIGAKLEVMQGSDYGKALIKKVQRMFELFLDAGAYPPKVAKYFPKFKEFVHVTEDIYLLSKAKIDEAKAKHELDGSLDGTVLNKIIQRYQRLV